MSKANTSDASTREFVLGQDLRTRILTTADETDGRLDLTDNIQAPAARTPVHLHTRYEERYWVLEGSLTVWAGTDVRSLHPGDFMTVPMNVPHAVQAGPKGARALVISSPAGFAELIARAATPAALATPETAFDADRFMAVTTELGDVVLGPPGTTPADVKDAQGAEAASS
jgi:mannose-6-phosphate isomerase-like protein (cupin superfamily)